MFDSLDSPSVQQYNVSASTLSKKFGVIPRAEATPKVDNFPFHSLPPENWKSKSGFVLATKGKSDVDELIREHADRPGPGDLKLEYEKPSGGKFSESSIDCYIDKMVRAKQSVPGPGKYDVEPSDANGGGMQQFLKSMRPTSPSFRAKGG